MYSKEGDLAFVGQGRAFCSINPQSLPCKLRVTCGMGEWRFCESETLAVQTRGVRGADTAWNMELMSLEVSGCSAEYEVQGSPLIVNLLHVLSCYPTRLARSWAIRLPAAHSFDGLSYRFTDYKYFLPLTHLSLHHTSLRHSHTSWPLCQIYLQIPIPSSGSLAMGNCGSSYEAVSCNG